MKTPILKVEAAVRYWEDGTVNGVEDIDGTLMPFREGEMWKPRINLETGTVLDWPQGVVAAVHYKVCDAGQYWLCDANETTKLQWAGYYVPDQFLCKGDTGYGDYIILNIGADGRIADWTVPVIIPDQWRQP